MDISHQDPLPLFFSLLNRSYQQRTSTSHFAVIFFTRDNFAQPFERIPGVTNRIFHWLASFGRIVAQCGRGSGGDGGGGSQGVGTTTPSIVSTCSLSNSSTPT